MTAEQRFERDLPDLLAELASGAAPDYRDDIVQRVAAVRQRPAWTFPERWLPMDDLSRRPALAFSVSWRTIGLVALLAALLAIALGAYIGSRPRVPDPFGPAANGAIAYSVDGDIHIRTAATGAERTVISDPGDDVSPAFSPDGATLAFIRHSSNLQPTETLMVANADGTNVRPVAGPEIGLRWWAWAPSSAELAVVSTAGGAPELSIVSVDGDAARRPIALPVAPETVDWRPPDGRELIFRGSRRGSEYSVYAVRPDGTGFRQVARDSGHPRTFLAPFSLSPDGRLAAYGSFDAADVHLRIHLLDLDTGVARVRPAAAPPASTQPSMLVHDGSPAFSPDGAFLVYNRYFNESSGRVSAQVFRGPLAGPDGPIGPAASIPAGTQGFYSQFSPDGASVLMYRLAEGDGVPPEPRQPQSFLASDVWLADLASQSAGRLEWTANDPPAWQRRAP